jgi:hypothetical protein
MPWPFYPWAKNPPNPLDRRLGGPQSRYRRCGKEKNTTPFWESNSGRPPHNYTDWPIPGLWRLSRTSMTTAWPVGTSVSNFQTMLVEWTICFNTETLISSEFFGLRIDKQSVELKKCPTASLRLRMKYSSISDVYSYQISLLYDCHFWNINISREAIVTGIWEN